MPKLGVCILALTATLVVTGCAERFNRNLVEAYLLAHNEHSAESMSALFLEDAEIHGPEGVEIRGREELDDLFEWFVVIESRLSTEVAEVDDTEVVLGPMVQKSALLSLFGLEQIEMEAGTRFVLDGSLFRAIHVTPMTRDSRLAFETAMADFLSWSKEHRSETVLPLLETTRLDGELATAWLAALRDWRDSTGS